MRGKFLSCFFICGVFLFSLISAGSDFASITGKVIEGLEDDLSQMSEEELMALYEANKDSISKEDIETLYKQNKDKIPKDLKEIYEENKDLITEDNIAIIAETYSNQDEEFSLDEENLEIYLELISCSLIKPFVDAEISSFEIPKKVPFKNEIFNIYLDEEFLISLNLVNRKFQETICEESESVTYNIYISKELVLEVIENKEDIGNPIDFYFENKKNGNLNIKPIGFGRRIKFSFINFGLKIAGWFD